VQGFGEAVAEFQGRAPWWLALGGGGYDLQAVARAWTLAFGVLSEQQIPDQVPPSYRETYGVSALRDAEEPPVRQSMRDDARKFAERSVLEIQRAVFQTHGLRAS
jgi:acetoin utilization deacetylase AcuC-like enzyme